ncbi:MAG: tolB protein precursor, periplasmic protein involved in the tonb-independent uptake of group A colicins [uncultured Solirubrobacteraceae bacterium]|uniref:TolB protein, periplasmic protein involved in the tonb-independent uptake of group A colicins n=1 Tax=uncultured Solirubrobacteraceae bacterium TaxID=1162706 RepID=A0A6J4RDY1_9ACTN|nr:MAG: tolB protein precursor, periplasmic protein involved in the tonb-independent uptake of group A colicins [uncultured Solirubrobacteraceae bacterium]
MQGRGRGAPVCLDGRTAHRGEADPTASAEELDSVFNGRIAFTSFRVDHDPGPGTLFNGDIFSIAPTGADLRQLTDDPGYDAQSDWSPDGTTIAYRIRKPQSRVNFEIARMPASGGRRAIITSTPTGLASSMPSWYPDGSALLFRLSGRAIDADIWTMGPMGEDPRLLIAPPGEQWYPSFNRDMSRIVFATTLSPVGDTDRGIFTSAADGSDIRLVYDAPGIMDTAPAWSPDGRRIAFESNSDPTGGNPEGDREIFIVGADGTGVRQLTSNAEHDEGPAFSPDGTMLVYSGGRDEQHGDIRVMTTAGVFIRQLTDFDGRDESPDWQPIPAPSTTRNCQSPADLVGRDLRSRGMPCRKARRLVVRWLEGKLLDHPRTQVRVDAFGGTDRVIITRPGSNPDRTPLVTFLVEPSAG